MHCCPLYSGSSWTLIQHRIDGSQNFNETWENYKYGFGQLDGKVISYSFIYLLKIFIYYGLGIQNVTVNENSPSLHKTLTVTHLLVITLVMYLFELHYSKLDVCSSNNYNCLKNNFN